MEAISTKDDAIQHAIAFLKAQDIAFARCAGATKLYGPVENFRRYLKGETQPGNRIWNVRFMQRILPPDTIDTGNGFSVLIDEVTGSCGIF